MGFCTASIEHLQLCSLASGLNVAVIVVTVIWGWGLEGGRLIILSGGRGRTASKDKDEKEKEKEKEKGEKKKRGGGGAVEVINNESVNKIYQDPKNKWLKLYER